jgi:hypothetical protein
MGFRTEETRMPSPKKGEQQSKFMQRCVSSSESQKSFPEQKQRVAFCHSQWKNKGKSCGTIFVYKDPITSELFHFSRQGVYKKNGRILIFVKRSRGEIMSDHILNRAAKSHAEDAERTQAPKNDPFGYKDGGKVCPKGQKWDGKAEKCLPVEADADWNFKKKDDDEDEKNGKDKKKNGKNGDKNGKNGDKKKKDNPFDKKKDGK